MAPVPDEPAVPRAQVVHRLRVVRAAHHKVLLPRRHLAVVEARSRRSKARGTVHRPGLAVLERRPLHVAADADR